MLKKRFFDLESNWENRLILFSVFLFPIVVATLTHGGTGLYSLLFTLSLFHIRGSWGLLRRFEKQILLGFLLFFLFSFLSLFMTEDLHEGFKRLERYLRFFALLPIYLMLRQKKLYSAKFYFAGTFVAVFVMCGQAIYQVEILKSPVANGAYHKIIMGNLAVLSVSFVVSGVLFYGKNKIHYGVAILAVMAGVYASLLSGSRTSWLFFPFILMSLVWLYRKKINKGALTLIVFGAIVVISLLGLLGPERLGKGFEEGWTDLKHFQENPNEHSSLGARLVMWRNSLLIFKDSPLLGTGMGDFKNDSQKLLENGLSYRNDFAVNQANAHNLYFQLLAEGGLVGLTLLMVTLFIFPSVHLLRLWRSAEDRLLHCYTLSGLIGVLAFAWFGISESWVNRNPMVTSYCFMMVVFLSSTSNRLEALKR